MDNRQQFTKPVTDMCKVWNLKYTDSNPNANPNTNHNPDPNPNVAPKPKP